MFAKTKIKKTIREAEKSLEYIDIDIRFHEKQINTLIEKKISLVDKILHLEKALINE